MKVGESVTYVGQIWTNTTGKNAQPGTSLDWELTFPDVDNKVDKVPGKGLSTEDFTTELKDDLIEGTRPDLVVVSSSANYPTAVVGPDGVMAHNLEQNTVYLHVVEGIMMAYPIRYPASDGITSTVVKSDDLLLLVMYTGTTPFIIGDDVNRAVLKNLNIFFSVTGTKLFSSRGDFLTNQSGLPAMIISNVLAVGCDVGRLDNMFGITIENFTCVGVTDGLKIHNSVVGVILKDVSFVENTGVANPYIVMTGITGDVAITNSVIATMIAGESYIAIDSGLTLNSFAIKETSFVGTAGTTFLQPELTGTLSLYQDLAALVTGSGTSYVDDGNGNVKVTVASTAGIYIGLTITNSATTSYNGDAVILKVPSTTEFVMNKSYVGDEVSGTYVGSGTRVTASAPHGFTDFRTSTITGSSIVEYDGANVARNTTASTYDIDIVFNGTAVTGSFSVTSLDQTHPKIISRDNGQFPSSTTFGSNHLNTEITIAGSGAGFELINDGVEPWVPGYNEQFVPTTDGLLEYTGIDDTHVVINGKTSVSKVGGGSDLIQSKIGIIRGVAPVVLFDESIGETQNTTPTEITSRLSGERLSTGDKVGIYVNNSTGAALVMARSSAVDVHV